MPDVRRVLTRDVVLTAVGVTDAFARYDLPTDVAAYTLGRCGC